MTTDQQTGPQAPPGTTINVPDNMTGQQGQAPQQQNPPYAPQQTGQPPQQYPPQSQQPAQPPANPTGSDPQVLGTLESIRQGVLAMPEQLVNSLREAVPQQQAQQTGQQTGQQDQQNGQQQQQQTGQQQQQQTGQQQQQQTGQQQQARRRSFGEWWMGMGGDKS